MKCKVIQTEAVGEGAVTDLSPPDASDVSVMGGLVRLDLRLFPVVVSSLA